MGFLERGHRRLLWVGFVLVSANVPLTARLLDDDSWLFNLVVAGLVGVVLHMDDAESVKRTD